MIQAFTRNITPITGLLPITFVLALMIPLTAMAETEILSCQTALTEIEHTRRSLLPLKQQQQQVQQHVRSIYQELFVCQTRTAPSLAQEQHCIELQAEASKQFKAMIEAITLSHQTSQLLTHQTRQAQLTCPNISEDTFPKIASLGHS